MYPVIYYNTHQSPSPKKTDRPPCLEDFDESLPSALHLGNRYMHYSWCTFVNLNENILQQGIFCNFFFVKIWDVLSRRRCFEHFVITFQQTKIIIIFIITIGIG